MLRRVINLCRYWTVTDSQYQISVILVDQDQQGNSRLSKSTEIRLKIRWNYFRHNARRNILEIALAQSWKQVWRLLSYHGAMFTVLVILTFTKKAETLSTVHMHQCIYLSICELTHMQRTNFRTSHCRSKYEEASDILTINCGNSQKGIDFYISIYLAKAHETGVRRSLQCDSMMSRDTITRHSRDAQSEHEAYWVHKRERWELNQT